MKKYSMIFTVLLLVSVLLTGCGCKHEWLDATCNAPLTCAKCGETHGEALGHTWAEATCAEAKHCQTCGTTEGEALPHTLTEANYQQAATCTVCGAEAGEPLEAYFEKMGIEINVTEPGVAYDYKLEDDNVPDGVLDEIFVVSGIETFSSDLGYEALDGYEWKRVQHTYITPKSERRTPGFWVNTLNYYEGPSGEETEHLEFGEQDTFSVNYYGKEYDQCLLTCTLQYDGEAFDETFLQDWCYIKVAEIAVRVPAEYDGIVLATFNKTAEIKEMQASGKPIGEAIINAPDTLFFRLK